MPFVDSHCHLDFPELAASIDSVLEQMRQNEVVSALCVSVNLEKFPQMLAFAERYPNLYASVGCIPITKESKSPMPRAWSKLAQHPRVIAIGETGLDYFRLKGDLEWQRTRFRNHIRAARECGKPLIIHTREAAADTLRIMAEENAAEAGRGDALLHRNLGSCRSRAGDGFLHLFLRHRHLQECQTDQGGGAAYAAGAHPARDRRPYLAPAPHRGKLNQPAYVKHVAEEIALLRGIGLG